MESKLLRKSIVSVYLRLLAADIVCLMFELFFVVARKAIGTPAHVIFSFLTVSITACLLGDGCMKIGTKLRNSVNTHKSEPCVRFGYKIGAISMIPSYMMFVIVLLGKFGIIGNFLPYYKLLNSWCVPFITLISSEISSAKISIAALVTMALYPVLFVVICQLCFAVTYTGYDVKQKLIYKNKG